MSHQLGCRYKEDFISKTGKTLRYEDRLELLNTPTGITWELLSHVDNTQIFNSYIEYQLEILKESSVLEDHLKECKAFFEKYGGIDNMILEDI